MKKQLYLNLKARYFNVLENSRVGLVLQDTSQLGLRFGVVYDLTIPEDRETVKKLIDEIEENVTFSFDVTTEEKNVKFKANTLGNMTFCFTPEDIRALSSKELGSLN